MKPLPNEELSVLCEQLEMILRAGLPVHDGVDALCDNYKGTRYSQCFEVMRSAVSDSGSLYEGMLAAGVFPTYMMEMTRIGEKTGETDNVMRELSSYYRREAQNHQAIMNAVLYPLLLIGMMAVLIAVLVMRVFPIFEGVFKSLGLSSAAAPWVGVGIDVGRGVLIAAGVFIVIVLLVLLMLRLDHSQNARRILFRVISPLGRLNEKLCASRFAATLSMMLRSGYPLSESLEMIEELLTDDEIRDKVAKCRAEMEHGESFPKAVEKLGIFERLHCRMISIGFQAGQTDRVMSKLASVYDEDMDNRISHLVSIIEPSLVALMCVIIGAILLSVMLPLLSIMSSIA